jgi:CRP-like cAMP-binding protein
MILPEELRGIEFLENLGAEHLNRIAMMARLEEHLEGTILFQEGQPAPFIYFVLSGTVGLEVTEPDGEAVEVCTVGPGELLGWSPVLGGRAMTATARTQTRCRMAVLDVKQVLELCERQPQFGVAFLRQVALVLSERLHGTRRCLALARSVSTRSLLGTVS